MGLVRKIGILILFYAVVAFLLNVVFASNIGHSGALYTLVHTVFNPLDTFIQPIMPLNVMLLGAALPWVWSAIVAFVGALMVIFD